MTTRFRQQIVAAGIVMLVVGFQPPAGKWESKFVTVMPNGTLQYHPDDKGKHEQSGDDLTFYNHDPVDDPRLSADSVTVHPASTAINPSGVHTAKSGCTLLCCSHRGFFHSANKETPPSIASRVPIPTIIWKAMWVTATGGQCSRGN